MIDKKELKEEELEKVSGGTSAYAIYGFSPAQVGNLDMIDSFYQNGVTFTKLKTGYPCPWCGKEYTWEADDSWYCLVPDCSYSWHRYFYED